MKTAVVFAASVAMSAAWTAPRSQAVRAEFMRQHPCPSTGATKGRCDGYVRDHIVPLCAGGADSPSNLQWQTVEAAKVKDRLEVAQCRSLKKTR